MTEKKRNQIMTLIKKIFEIVHKLKYIGIVFIPRVHIQTISFKKPLD